MPLVPPLLPPPDARIGAARQFAAAGRWDEVCSLVAPLPVTPALASELMLLRGEAHLRTGDAPAARAWLPEALAIARARHDRIAERTMWNQLGAANFELGRLDEADTAFHEALQRARQEGDDLLAAQASNNLGMIANIRGQCDLAAGHYQLAIPAYQRLGHVRGLAETYHNLALTARDQHQFEAAEHHERQAIEFAEQAHDERLLVMGEIGLAEICLLRGDAALAERRALRAARRCKARRDASNEADALRIAGAALLASGRALAAGRVLSRAIFLAQSCGAALIEAEAHAERARFHVTMGNREFADADAAHALAIFDRLGATQSVPVRAWLASTRGNGTAPPRSR